jgi:hypothetical protein
MRVLKDGGHARQLENFNTLISIATELGTEFNPAKENLKLVSLKKIYTEATDVLEDWIQASNEMERATSLRRDAITKIGKFVTSIGREAKICGINGEVMEDVKLAIKQCRSSRSSEKVTQVEGEINNKVQKGGSSYNSTIRRIESYFRLIDLLAATPEYESNNDELRIEALKESSSNLRDLQQKYMASLVKLERIRGHRDRLLFSKNASIVSTGQLVKDYLRNHFKDAKTELKTISAIRFATPF